MITQSLTSLLLPKSNHSWTEKTVSATNSKNRGDEEERRWPETKSDVRTRRGSNESEESLVQWNQNNVKDGLVIVDEAQLSKLIKREPIEKYYKLEREPFAKGVFASVRKCQSLESGECYAAKFTSRERYGEDCSTEIYHEIALLSLCGSAPRVIKIHDVFETLKEIIIVMEYAPGGDLQTIIDENLVPFESDVMSFIRQTVEGLDYLHKRKIAHLDIKPQNIVMMGDYPRCEIKLCDFEISRVILEGKVIRELLGTPDYVAPEILHYEPITLAADMWSLGVTTYVLLSGYSPFGGETDQETFCNISRGDVDFPSDLFKDVSNEAIDFVKSLLVKNPKARLTASECLKHAWLNAELKPNQTESVKSSPVQNNDLNVEEELLDARMEADVSNGRPVEVPSPKNTVKKDASRDATLKKYLSKSRESLFESVTQRQGNYNSKRNTTKSSGNRFRKIRACKSQISLISKSQEKLLEGEMLSAPSRSIEKLYGFRSLSKSQEVLNLYKTGGLLTSQDNLDLVTEIIKSRESLCSVSDLDQSKSRRLMRATTADLGILHQRNKPSRMNSCSSTASFASFSVNVAEDGEEDDDYDNNNEEREEKRDRKRKDSVFSTASDVDNHCNDRNRDVKKESDGKLTKEVQQSENDEQKQKYSTNKSVKKVEEQAKDEENEEEEDEEEEPRFTVAQLITAYNKHQEIVTKTSLEVTMSAQEKKVKIPPLIPYKSKSLFPTGPTALRLFIPDIDLVSMPKKFVPKYKMRFPEEKNINGKEKCTSPREQPKSLRSFHMPQVVSNIRKDENHDPTLTSYLMEEESLQIRECTKRKNEGTNRHNNNNNQENVKPCLIVPQKHNGSPMSLAESARLEAKKSTSLTETQKTEEINRRRSPTPSKRLGVTRSYERSPSATRKPLTVEKSPVPQRKTCPRIPKTDEICPKRPETFSQYKIVGERNGGRKSSGVSYKIEFDSPIVKRKFPTRNLNLKGTISSNLKVRETVHRARK